MDTGPWTRPLRDLGHFAFEVRENPKGRWLASKLRRGQQDIGMWEWLAFLQSLVEGDPTESAAGHPQIWLTFSCLHPGRSSLSLAFDALHHHLRKNPLLQPRSFFHFLPSKTWVEAPPCLCPCCFSSWDAAPLTPNYLSRVTCGISFSVGLFLSRSSSSHLLQHRPSVLLTCHLVIPSPQCTFTF